MNELLAYTVLKRCPVRPRNITRARLPNLDPAQRTGNCIISTVDCLIALMIWFAGVLCSC